MGRKKLITDSNIKFAKQVAKDYDHDITTEEAIKALKVTKGDYYRMKEYFLN